MKVLITGGHHSSALPVVSLLQHKHSDVKLYWFGHKYSAKGDKNPTLEYREITGLNIPFYDLKAGKFYKTYNLVRLAKIPFGFIQAFFWLLKLRPDIVLSFGGYLAVPTVLAAYTLRIPVFTHEQTVVVGWANTFISRFAKVIFISFNESRRYFDQTKVIFSGLPLRKSVFEIKSKSFASLASSTELPYIFILGGKIGSHIINSVILDALPILLNKYNLIHQCGDNSVFNDYDRLQNAYKSCENSVRGSYFLRKFIFDDEIGEAFHKAELVISRSGAHSVGELLALKKKCILIPIPWVSHNEQEKNAQVAVEAGIGTILKEAALTPQNLLEALDKSHDHQSVLNEGQLMLYSYPRKPLPEEIIVQEILKLK